MKIINYLFLLPIVVSSFRLYPPHPKAGLIKPRFGEALYLDYLCDMGDSTQELVSTIEGLLKKVR